MQQGQTCEAAFRLGLPLQNLADLRSRQRRYGIDVIFGDEARASVDVNAGEAVFLGKADVEDGHIALQPLLLIVDEADPAVLDALNGRAAQVKAACTNVTRFLARRLKQRRQGRGQVTVIDDDGLEVGV